MHKDKIELLCPARDIEVAKQAILAGADAVYIGSPAFGARTAAANSVEEIAKLTDFAHLYGCKVYVALNTILTDEELKLAVQLTHKLYEAKVDALIVQDMGLASSCDIAPIPLHASTQCHIASVETAKFLDECGFKTLVLARELSLEQIAEIKKAVKANIECFVHGALCVSYSGRCLLSQAIGGRSGNRGQCAQPCRMEYKLVDANFNEIAKSAHFLCLRDMNRSASIKEMLEAGVSSLKIEGRLKDGSYVKNLAAYYRQALDVILPKLGLEKSSFGTSSVKFSPDPSKTFNRGFTEYHLHGTQKGCSSFSTPKSKGEFIGIAKKTFKGGFYLDNADKIFSNGDGLLFETSDGFIGAGVSKVEQNKIFVGRPQDNFSIPQNSNIWRNFDTKFQKQLDTPIERKMPIHLSAEINNNTLILRAITLDSRSISAEINIDTSKNDSAQNQAQAKQKFTENFSKLGSTEFTPQEISINIENFPFLRPSEINEIRRQLIENLKQNIIFAYNSSMPIQHHPLGIPAKSLSSHFETDYNLNVLNSQAEKFYLDRNVNVTEYAAESNQKSLKGKSVMRSKHCILRELGLCKKDIHIHHKKFPEPLHLISNSITLKIHLDCPSCSNIFYCS